MEDEVFNEFLNESREHLANIEADLLAIEEAGANLNEELVNKTFRAAHSIKGGASFFGLTRVKDLAHKAETVLDMLRSRRMTPNAEITNVLLAAFDRLRDMINNPKERETADISELVTNLTGLASSYLPADQKATLTQTVTLSGASEERPVKVSQVDFDRARRAGQCVYEIDYDLIHDIEQKGANVLKIFRELEECGEILDCQLDLDALGTLDGPIGKELPLRLVFAATLAPESVHELVMAPPDRIQLLFDPSKPDSLPPVSTPEPVATPSAEAALETIPSVALETDSEPPPRSESDPEPAPSNTASARSAPSEPASANGTAGAPAAAQETLRVSVALLESLMNLAGELVLSRNQLCASTAQKDEDALSAASQRINQVTSELQDAIMQTRLQPIGNVFAKFPRLVRDMAQSLQKEIQLDIRGKDVALDRSLIEGLSDPLTHMVRNAVDHGIERPADRVRTGKPSLGTIRLEARHEAGQVVVEIADDGKGIDVARVADSALKKGLVTQEKLRAMSTHDKLALIFLPGLSTAEKVTDLSGRGVGMDVVKTNLERLGGKVDITSEIGKGSLFRIKLPLTLAIIPSLIVSVGKDRFAIPQINVEELLRIRPEEIRKRIEVVGEAEVLLLRDKIIPLVYLDRLLAGKSQPNASSETTATPSESTANKTLEVAVVTTGTTRYGLVVSTFHETEEIVVKPLGRHLKGLREYAGATILGDGTVALILDVAGVAGKAELTSVNRRTDQAAHASEEGRTDELQSLLLFRNAVDQVCAAPLDSVLRIERITPDRIETVGQRRTVQYRGASLPLVTLSDAAQIQPLADTRDLAVIVSNVHGREIGLLGAMPVDVVESRAVVDRSTHRQTGISGSAIIRDRTTLIADVSELVAALYPEWTQPAEPATTSETSPGSVTLLLAEDSDFFRAQIKKYLEQAGFHVLDAPDGEAAWDLLLDHASQVQAVVTDVEMPRLTGLELARRIRGDERVSSLPVIALSSLAGEEDIAKGKAAGVDDYLVKLDRDQLLTSVNALIERKPALEHAL